jgi:hypothetical protein
LRPQTVAFKSPHPPANLLLNDQLVTIDRQSLVVVRLPIQYLKRQVQRSISNQHRKINYADDQTHCDYRGDGCD